MTVLPARSTRSAPAGTATAAAAPTAAMRSPFEDDAAGLDRRRAGAVDDAHVVEDDQPALGLKAAVGEQARDEGREGDERAATHGRRVYLTREPGQVTACVRCSNSSITS